MTRTDDTPITPGAWVRFWRDGRLIIGIVQYPPYRDQLSYPFVATDLGEVRESAIVEVRKPTTP